MTVYVDNKEINNVVNIAMMIMILIKMIWNNYNNFDLAWIISDNDAIANNNDMNTHNQTDNGTDNNTDVNIDNIANVDNVNTDYWP